VEVLAGSTAGMDEAIQARADDLRLLRRTAEGDETALSELHRRHARLCLRRAFDVLRDHALADDAVQEAFVDLWKTAGSFDARRASVRTWLCVLVHRRSVDIARREARRRLTQTQLDAPAAGSHTAEELLILRLDRRRIQAALTGLSAPHREVLELAYYGGLTQSEVAQHLGVPLGTIKSRTSDALARLAALFAPLERESAW
jgi:RNA polymerase sigma-70 factor (ECF subfamily)